MSDQLTAAANALGIPEALVERSAAARAAEAGASTEDILAAWAGGEAAPASSPPEEPEEAPEAAQTEEPADEDAGDREPPTPDMVVEAPAGEQAPSEEPPPPPGPYKTPVLVGVRDNPMTILTGVVTLFLVVFLVGLVGPSFQGEAPGARTSEIDYSEQAVEGRNVYASLNCVSCHTQMVRPVIADVGLGAVTVHDTNQILGTRRFGPDLSNVGSRVSESQLAAIIGGLGEHPTYSLTDDHLSALVAYLGESRTLEGEAPPDSGESGSETGS